MYRVLRRGQFLEFKMKYKIKCSSCKNIDIELLFLLPSITTKYGGTCIRWRYYLYFCTHSQKWWCHAKYRVTRIQRKNSDMSWKRDFVAYLITHFSSILVAVQVYRVIKNVIFYCCDVGTLNKNSYCLEAGTNALKYEIV